MKKSNRKPLDSERQFAINEMFFSTTDGKGIITSGNDIFIRVSGFSREELIGEPHNIIRHPEMPRAVFKLLWDFLEADKSITAYVKNMAADGAYYWVVALATPIPGGYLSVRFKPSSPLLGVVSGLYQKLLQTEAGFGDDWREGMAAATNELVATLASLGFKSYDQFMRTMLQEELKSRDIILLQKGLNIVPAIVDEHQITNGVAKVGSLFAGIYSNSKEIYAKLNALFNQLDNYVHLSSELEKKSKFVLELTEGFRFISLNTSVRSAKLGGAGASLSVIADYMQNASTTIGQVITTLNSKIQYTSDVLREIIFSLAGAKLQTEMVMIFCADIMNRLSSKDVHVSHGDIQEMKTTMKDLQAALRWTIQTALNSLNNLASQLGGLDETSDELNKTVIALQFIQLGGLVEACRLDEEKGFGVIFSEVKNQLERAKDELKELSTITQQLNGLVADRSSIDTIFNFSMTHNDKHIEAIGVQ